MRQLKARVTNVVDTVSVLTILKNPMILMGVVTMGMFVGMPYLMKNSTFTLLPPPSTSH